MKFIDLHSDTLMKLARKDARGDLYENPDTSITFKKMLEAGQKAQFFAVFLAEKEYFKKENISYRSPEEYVEGRIRYLKDNVEKYSNIVALARNYQDLIDNDEQGKISAFLTLEEGAPVDGSLRKLEDFFEEGVRLITLTWNFENCFGFPNSFDPEIMSKGLKAFGVEAVQRMEELGMLVDVSHLSDGGFYDCAKILKKTFIASHSNARELTEHPRNLTDDMIKVLANAGGIAGLNFCPVFLDREQVNVSDNWVNIDGDNKKKVIVYSRVSDMVKHLNHMKNKGGEDFVALGSDLDGIGGELEINEAKDFDLLFNALRKDGWNESQIEKLAYKNAERVIKEVLK